MLTGLNHLPLAVEDLDRSVDCYHHLFGLRLRACWDAGPYLSMDVLWASLDSITPNGCLITCLKSYGRSSFRIYRIDLRSSWDRIG